MFLERAFTVDPEVSVTENMEIERVDLQSRLVENLRCQEQIFGEGTWWGVLTRRRGNNGRD